jgi:hypothetical protein
MFLSNLAMTGLEHRDKADDESFRKKACHPDNDQDDISFILLVVERAYFTTVESPPLPHFHTNSPFTDTVGLL